jgi:hypothetical protein
MINQTFSRFFPKKENPATVKTAAMEIPLMWTLRNTRMDVKITVSSPLLMKAAPMPPTSM